MIHLTFTSCVFKWQDEGTGKGLPQSAHAPEAGKKRGNFDAQARQKTHSGFTRPEQGARGAANRAGDRKNNPSRFRLLHSSCCCSLAAAALWLLHSSCCCTLAAAALWLLHSSCCCTLAAAALRLLHSSCCCTLAAAL